jgi:hypothetical protein
MIPDMPEEQEEEALEDDALDKGPVKQVTGILFTAPVVNTRHSHPDLTSKPENSKSLTNSDSVLPKSSNPPSIPTTFIVAGSAGLKNAASSVSMNSALVSVERSGKMLYSQSAPQESQPSLQCIPSATVDGPSPTSSHSNVSAGASDTMSDATESTSTLISDDSNPLSLEDAEKSLDYLDYPRTR